MEFHQVIPHLPGRQEICPVFNADSICSVLQGVSCEIHDGHWSIDLHLFVEEVHWIQEKSVASEHIVLSVAFEADVN